MLKPKLDYSLNSCYKNRIITSSEKPQFKLDAFCINLDKKYHNMHFINSEWKDFCNITRFSGLSSATESHVEILKAIYNNRKSVKFPIVVMEDDVYRKNDFTKYWNKLLKLNTCDYVTFDAFYLSLKDSDSDLPSYFASLKGHRMMGFTVYYKKFFERFRTINELVLAINRNPIDMNFTNNEKIIKYTPKQQVCCQIVSKFSDTKKKVTSHYLDYYKEAENILKTIDKTIDKKIFIIGFNKTGTRSFMHYFIKNSIPVIHWDENRLARAIKFNYDNKRKLLTNYENFTVFCDMEDIHNMNFAHVTYFKEMDKQYPNSKFILNIRNVEKWIESRNNHQDDNGNYTDYFCKKLKLTKEEVNDKWRKEFYEHNKNVIKYFSDKPNKLLIYHIENDNIEKLNDFLPEYQLNADLYYHEGKT